MRRPYHSALGEELGYAEVSRVARRSCVAFVHDIRESHLLPHEFSRCDVFYTDLPWEDGLQKFDSRAGGESVSYAKFLGRIDEIATTYRPAVLVTGKKSLKYLTGRTAVFETKLRGARCVAAVYGTLKCSVDWESGADAILETLSSYYSCIGDFCCGYGRAGMAFAKKGKTFVMSDYNPRCIGGIDAWL